MATKNRTSTSRTRGKKAVVMPTETNDSRIFRALQERPYSVPKLKLDTSAKPNGKKTRFPAYIDSQGQLYDVDYFPLSPSEAKNAPQGSLEQKLAFDPSSEVWTKMPHPSNYDNFFRYEQALLEWKVNAQLALGSLQLPSIVGRHYYRPRVAMERNRGASVSNDYLPEDINKEEQEDKLSPEDEELYSNFPYRSEVSKKQFAKLVEKKKQSVLQLDQNKQFKLVKDSWDSHLVSQEPDPAFYDKYEDYAAAMKRWASLCATQLPTIPPHATQLKDLIPIQTAEAESSKEEIKTTVVVEETEKEAVVEKVKSGLIETDFFQNSGPSFPSSPTRIESFQGIEQLGPISSEARAKVQEFFETLLKNQTEKHERLKSFNRPILPTIHGTFPKPNATGLQKLKTNQKNKILRRTDLTGPMISSCYDCPGEVEGKRVEFKNPEFDVESLLLTKLKTDQKWREQTKMTLRQTQYADRNDNLNAWYFPTLPKEFHLKHRAEIDQILQNVKSDKISIPNIIAVLETPMLLDKFQDLFAESMPEGSDGVGRTFLQAFLNAITPENFHEILVMFEKHSFRLIHAKLSVFVSETLQSSRAKIILEKFINSQDVKNLGFVAYAMQFFNDVPVEIYPFAHQWTDLYPIISQLNPSFEPIIRAIMCHYYIHLISETMTKHPFLFVAINQFVTESRKSTAYTIVSLLEQNPTFLSKSIWDLIGHRSSTVSAFFFFIFVRLLNNRDSGGFKEMLTNENTHFIENLKKLSLSKFTHTQFAVKRIFRKLQIEPWEDWLYSLYQSNMNMLIEDLTLPRKKNGELSLYSELVFELCFNSLEKAKLAPQKFNFLLRESFFHGTLDFIIKNQKQVDETTESLCLLLTGIARTSFNLGYVKPVESIKGSSRNLNNSELSITPGDLQKFISLISEIERKDRSAPDRKYVAKRYMLACLRHLIKSPGVWEFLKKETIFFTTILGFCRDGKDKEFNREAWRTFYQIIFYHHGVLEYLIKQNTLSHFVELVGTSSTNTVMINGLHYITKLFSMPATQQRRIAEGKYEIRAEIPKESFKTFEKDTKKLNTFFVDKSLFIKVHMIYKKISPLQQGLAFLELAKFYHALSSVPVNSKLYKDTVKKAEYKAGLHSIQGMFSPDAPEDFGSPGSSIKTKAALAGKEKISKLLSSRGSHKD